MPFVIPDREFPNYTEDDVPYGDLTPASGMVACRFGQAGTVLLTARGMSGDPHRTAEVAQTLIDMTSGATRLRQTAFARIIIAADWRSCASGRVTACAR